MVIDFEHWIIFGILCLQCVGRCHLDFTNVCSYGVMYINYCCCTKLAMFPWIYKLEENSKRNYCFHHFKWFIPLFRIWDVPNEILRVFFSLFFSKVVLHDRAFFLLVVFLLYFIHLLVSTATVRGGKNRASVTILNSYLVFLFRTICIFNSVSWLFRAIFKLKSYNLYGLVQRKRITFATSTFADCSDWCAVCLGLETRADLKQTSFLTGELWRETNFLTRFHSTSPWEI